MGAHQKHWFAVYTKSRTEKKLHSLLCDKDITSFLPVIKEMRQWSDRKKLIERPLLPSYVFVHVSAADRFNVLNTPGAVRYVSFEGQPAPVPEKQIEYLQNILANRPSGIQVDYSHIEQGDRVEVVSGPLRGVHGEIVQFKGRYRILLRFESIQCCIHAEISMDEVVPLKEKRIATSLTLS